MSRPALLRIGDGNNGGSYSLKFVKESIIQVKVESSLESSGLLYVRVLSHQCRIFST